MDPKQMQFMQIAMKYLPEAKDLLDETGIELDMAKLQPVMELLTKVMSDAYDLGKQEALQEK
ncbi:ComZ family protein [Bacillus suaedaesalsae]|uniref:Competence protein ComG n=1 Tax=Bacillus suaedaesalsae TaxID=2810349 RepID=A0ABS2DIQ7_9BACI|nr:ComZ family protein [Bacillus suaedaesalsae]MBM6618297.1 competence protein ComG [Bacillus suaedaesalsae]